MGIFSRIGNVLSNSHKGSKNKVSLSEARMPERHRAYVIGDIHGRADLLKVVLDKVADDMTTAPPNVYLIFLGDYVDRGHQSREVIDMILSYSQPGLNVVTLAGNHEEAMLDFLREPHGASDWLRFGGIATLHSYRVGSPPGVLTREKQEVIAENLNENLPDKHRQFLEDLDDWFELGDYMFVHAGIDPSRSLSRQDPQQSRWIREPFLSHSRLYEKVVVHGHTITDKPEFHPNRISIDTGAYYSGNLTCLVLENNDRRRL